MKIRIKQIEHERTEDAPFVGALVSSIGCKIGCKGCFNRHLKKLPTQEFEAEEIIEEILSNRLNEGIILGGLEWSEQTEELLEIVDKASKANLKIIIYTGKELLDFYDGIGREMYLKVTGNKEIEDSTEFGFFKGFFQTLGASALDYHTPNGYFLKCGGYDREKLHPTEDYSKFGVNLVSTNQKLFEIRGEYNDH